MYRSTSLPAWVVREYLQGVHILTLQRFAKRVLRKRRAVLVLQRWWRDDPQFEKNMC